MSLLPTRLAADETDRTLNKNQMGSCAETGRTERTDDGFDEVPHG